jgi:hypothetical protein
MVNAAKSAWVPHAVLLLGLALFFCRVASGQIKLRNFHGGPKTTTVLSSLVLTGRRCVHAKL